MLALHSQDPFGMTGWYYWCSHEVVGSEDSEGILRPHHFVRCEKGEGSHPEGILRVDG